MLIEGKTPNTYRVCVPGEVSLYNNSSLVFRIETESGQYIYQWMVHITLERILEEVLIIDHLLNLEIYSGLSITVSFAYATKDGLSAYSEPREVTIFNTVASVYPSDTRHSLVTSSQEEAQNTALCHVACISYALQEPLLEVGNYTGENITEEEMPFDGSTTGESQQIFQVCSGIVDYRF